MKRPRPRYGGRAADPGGACAVGAQQDHVRDCSPLSTVKKPTASSCWIRARLRRAAHMPNCSPTVGCIRNCIACSSTTDTRPWSNAYRAVYRESRGSRGSRHWRGSMPRRGGAPRGICLRLDADSARRKACHRGWQSDCRGTGKTPLVAWLAQQLSLSGLRVGIVSRGYGRSKREPEGVHAESSWRTWVTSRCCSRARPAATWWLLRIGCRGTATDHTRCRCRHRG